MVKWLKVIVSIVLVMLLTAGAIYATQPYYVVTSEGTIENYSYINQLLFESSRYTQTDVVDQEILDAYHNDYQVTYPTDKLDILGYELMLETDDLNIYFEKDSFSMVVYNEETGYYWSSRPELQGISGVREDNTATRNLMNSGLIVEYIRIDNEISASAVKAASLYTFADVEYENNGAITEEENDLLRPFYIVEDSYDYDEVETVITQASSTEFTVEVSIYAIDVYFDVTIRIEDDQLKTSIDQSTIEETGDRYRLMSIQLFPYFGAAREDLYPGYIVIPDGVGALVRTNQRYNISLQTRFYGTDYGYQSETVTDLSLPVYGMIHEVNQNGFYAAVTEGAETSSLILRLWGDSTRYQRVNAKYNVRQIYRYIINRAGDGNDEIDDEHTSINYELTFSFLSNDEASYVGMATDYRDMLIDEGTLTDREQINDDQIPIQLSYIMNAHESAFIGTKRIEMTTPEQVSQAYTYFEEEGLTNQLISLLGWSKKDDMMTQVPYRLKLDDQSAYVDLIEEITNDGNRIYLDNDYTFSSEDSTRISYNRDVSTSLSKLKMSYTSRSLNGQITDYYLLYPMQSLSLAQSDVSFFSDLGITGLQLQSTGNMVFSYYDDGVNYERDITIDYYQQMMELYDSVILSSPNDYLFESLDAYLDMPITNTQYDFYTDLIPFIPIVLKGSISAYTPYLNFNALEEDRLLMMVDFALNPSYILTEEETYAMRYTNASSYYTTQLDNYRDEIVETYHYLNDALKYVVNAKIVNREVLQTGFVKVTYDNDVIIYVNYTYDPQVDETLIVQPRDYKVVI